MSSRSAPDGHELVRIDELREFAVRLLRLQVQKLLDVASPFFLRGRSSSNPHQALVPSMRLDG